MIIVVAVTGLGSFAIPGFSLAYTFRGLRFIFIIAGSVFGLFGVSLAFVLQLALVTSMKSFGMPFLAPVVPRTKINGDIFLRYPAWKQERTPDEVNAIKKKRQPKVSRDWTKSKP